MTPQLTVLIALSIALICISVVYVARLHYADREHERTKADSKLAGEIEALRRKLDEIEKTAREAHVMAATRATSRIRN